MNDEFYIKKAIALSQESVDAGGYPVGSLVVSGDEIIATGLSNGKNLCDATSHAEIDAIREAGKKLEKRNLGEVTLYSSLEPCLMCFAASFWAYIPRVVFACSKGRVSSDHFEGTNNIFDLNKNNRRQIELTHHKEFEEMALEVITAWESGLIK